MSNSKRAHLFSLISLLFILLGFNADLPGQENEEVPEEAFSRLIMELDYKTPRIVPFPKRDVTVGISFAGPVPGLLAPRKIKYQTDQEFHRKTRHIEYSRKIGNHKVETERFSDYLMNARAYGDAEVARYWKENLYQSTKKSEADKASGLVNVKFEIPDAGLLKSIAGESSAGLNVTGYQKISFSGRSQWTDTEDDALNKVSKFPSLDMEQVSRYSITGTIGTKITVEVDQNSERKTDLANTIKIRYKGTEDEIIQTIEAGNTNLSLPNTQFVGYSQQVQGLFGIKSTAKIGALDLTAIISQEKGSTESSTFEAGASKTANSKRDYDYLERTFFWLFRAEDDVDSIVESEIYVFWSPTSTGSGSETVAWDSAYVSIDPDNYGSYPQEDRITTVRKLDYDDYYVYNNSLYLEMFSTYRNRLIAGWFKVKKGDGSIVEIGSRTSGTLNLKLIALTEDEADNTYYTWNNEWRNVYSLGVQDIDPDGITLKIYKGAPGTEDQEDKNLDYQNNIPYIEIMGLDRYNVAGEASPDGIIDAKNNNILLRDRGYLVFPDPHPFDPSTSYATTGEELEERVPEIYTTRHSTVTSNSSDYTKYYLLFETAQRQTEYYLGKVNIIENSERVLLNGEELQKDRDYRIYYEIGRISFLTDAVTDPNSDLEITFEYEPFISSEKKSLFGARGEYEISSDFKIGATVLYKGEKSTDRKPRVGQETSKSLVWDADFDYAVDLPFLTTLTDALPLIEASAKSRLSISGEVAQSRPNPNTAGEAYVDDFESAKEEFSLGITRYIWTKSSAPSAFEQDTRGKLIWYNPYDAYAVTDIYNRDVQEGSDRKTTLTLKFEPSRYILETNPEDECNPYQTEIDPTESWAGIMRAFSSGSQDQTSSQLLEIRMRVNGGRIVDKGKLYIELGDVTEDINGDGVLNSEDTSGNGILEVWEDTGLDNLNDTSEACYDAVNNPDPNGDDYNYDTKDDYSQINGTEGNRLDVGGSIPDSEDLDGAGSLNTTNKFFRFLIDLTDDEFKVEGSYLNGWETYRIPLRDTTGYESVNSPDWGRIPYARMYLTGFDTTVYVEIADINLVSTRWEEDTLIYPTSVDRSGLADPPDFNISVINTEENFDYTPPPGVSGYYDKSTDTYEKEQSLLLHFENLQFYQIDTEYVNDLGETIDTFYYAPDTILAERTLYSAEDYAGYQVMRMYIHGPDTLPESGSSIHYMLRMGDDAENYYQFQTNIYPGWHDSNNVVIDFNEITLLKDKLNQLKEEDATLDYIQEGKYSVRGSPALTSIIYFAVGVTNTDTINHQPISGDLWMDELRITDVRDNVGTAVRLSVSGGLSDFVTYSASYKNQDAYFRNLTSSNSTNLGSGKSEKNYSYSTKVNLHKILPPSWGASLPFSYSWSERRSTPRLKSGSDIVIPEEQKEEETTVSKSLRWSISQSFRKQGGNLLFGILLNRLKTSYSYSQTDSRTPTVPSSHSESYTAKATYDMTPSKSITVPILFWLKPIPLLPKSISQTQLGLLPSKLDFSGTVKKSYSKTVNSSNYTSSSYSRVLDGAANLSWAIFKTLTADYTMNTERDIGDDEDLHFSLNPNDIRLGIELENSQTLNMNYGPSLFKWLTHKFSYRATYSEDSDPANNDEGTRNISNGNTISINSTFSPKTFFGINAKGGAPAKTDSTKGGGFKLHRPFLKLIRFFSNRVDDIQGTYSIDKRYTRYGLEDRPGWKYIFGFTDDPGVGVNEEAISMSAREQETKSTSYSARSGIKFILGTKIGTRYAHSEKESSSSSTRSASTTFPDLSFSLSNLERYRVFRFFFNSLSFDTKYTKKVDETFRTATREYLSDKSTTDSYSPLFKIDFTWFKKLQCTFQYDKSQTLKESYVETSETVDEVTVYGVDLNSGVRSTSNSWQFTARTTLSPQQGIKFPLLGKLKSTLTLNLSISRKNTKSESNQYQGKGWSTTSDRTDFTVTPRISYSFSSNINGGLSARWQDTNDKTRYQKSHVRELGIWVEIKF